MFQFLSPPDPRYPVNSVNYFSMVILFFIALISWVGMSIANRAIRDARRHAANLQTILDSIADGVLVLDLKGHMISANPSLLHMIPQDKLKEVIAKPLEKNIQLERKSFSVNSSAVPDVGSVAVFRDETRRHEVEHVKDALLATVSHELRTPLMVTMNYLEMMHTLVQTGKSNSPKFVEYLQHAIESSERLNYVVNNVIEQAQLQAGLLKFKQQACNLTMLLEKTHKLFETLLRDKGLSYALTVAPNVPAEVTGDPDRLQQVLANLIGNGIKFTKQGGIKIDVFLEQAKTLSIKVVDTGTGIPEEQLPDIFEPFRRGSDYALREQRGAGLGLSIAKEIITRMGGTISVDSVLDVGSTFTISLPVDGVPQLT
jgi:signal transduction histidine kinase